MTIFVFAGKIKVVKKTCKVNKIYISPLNPSRTVPYVRSMPATVPPDLRPVYVHH